MIAGILRLSLMDRLGFIQYLTSRRMFRKPAIHILLFAIEYVLISIGYVLLHNGLSDPELMISLSKSLYFTVITSATVGYGDHFPVHTITQWYVITLMILYLPSRFFYVAGLAGFLFKNYRDLKRIGRWFPMLSNHVIIYCNAATIERNNFMWLERFIAESRKTPKFKGHDVLVVNGNQDANDSLIHYFTEKEHELDGVRFINININENDFFNKIAIEKALRVYVLADEMDVSTDSDVFDMVYRIEKETSYDNGVTAELVNDRNRDRIAKLGANVILRPNRSMPEMIIRCTNAPGAAKMIEEIVSSGGDSIERFDLNCKEFQWGDLLYQFNMNDIGLATAVIYEDESVDSNPCGKLVIKDAKAVLLLIHEVGTKDYSDIQHRINEIMDTLVCKRP
nr:ion channel [Vibrio splendidus]MCC4880446.1 potassium channel family protein [Vibrio splendidus]